MNSVNITGRLTDDVELKFTTDSNAVCSFAVAVDRPYAKDTVDFLQCVAWRQKAEFVAKYFKKGDGIEVTGYISTRSYEDKNGVKHKVTEICADQVNFVKARKSEDKPVAEKPSEPDSVDVQEFIDNNLDELLPF